MVLRILKSQTVRQHSDRLRMLVEEQEPEAIPIILQDAFMLAMFMSMSAMFLRTAFLLILVHQCLLQCINLRQKLVFAQLNF